MDTRQSSEILEKLIPYIYRMLRSEKNDYYKKYSLTPTQMDVLSTLKTGSMNLSTLSELVLLDSSTLVGIVDKLEKRELLIKKVSPKDRRKNNLKLTRKGNNLLRSIPPFTSPILKLAIEKLGDKEKKQFIDIMNSILRNLELEDLMISSKNELKPVSPIATVL
ncbi:MAG: MarR family winged helix-turn-helix transcriptional regulator [Candidatus Eremiobacteraeota bacterium]|nr:MarR family winged helix-turn-helix transcriptional regulator [Candidatus Eremiobacteraeota bacterium]